MDGRLWVVASRVTTPSSRSLVRVLLGMSLSPSFSDTCLMLVNREVHKAQHRLNGTAVALKRILMHNEKEGMPVTALREIKILKALRHPCIVDILDMFVVRSTRLLTCDACLL